MKLLWQLATIGTATLAECNISPPQACPSGLNPVTAVAPVLPRRLHNEFATVARVAVVVETSGEVSSARILSATYRPLGDSGGNPVGYAEAIVAAVRQWKFSAPAKRCYREVKVELFEEFAGA